MKRILSFLMAIVLICPLLYVSNTIGVEAALNTEGKATNNQGMFAPPTPGEVTIDGEFEDWDWSGRIISYADYDLQDLYKVEYSSMWDEEFLYLGFKYNDNTPMLNTYDPAIEPSWTWRGDAIQLRFITDRLRGWYTLAPYQPTNVGSLFVAYPNDGEECAYITESGGVKLDKVTYTKGEVKKMSLKGEICYKLREEGSGYNVEVKLPWDMLYINPKVAEGTVFQMGVELYWGDPTGTKNNEYQVFDNAQVGKSGGGYTRDNVWGDVTLMGSGNLELRTYEHDVENTAEGTIKIPVKVPKDAKKVTLRLEDEMGNVIANAVNETTIDETNIIEYGSDYNIVETLYDGLDEYGEYIPWGEYTVTGITHNGITPYFDAVAYNPGNPPWPDSTGNGGWASDHHPPVSIVARGDKIIIGSTNAESGVGIFEIDNDGKKLWSCRRGGDMLAVNDGYVYALPGNDFYADTTQGNTYLLRMDAETGKMTPFVLDGENRDLLHFVNNIFSIKQGITPSITGLTANNDYVVLGVTKNNKRISSGFSDFGEYLYVVDPYNGNTLKKIALPNVESITFGKDDMLYAVTGDCISRVDIATGKITKTGIMEKDGEDFGVIAADNNNNLVVFDKKDRQLKTYNLQGSLISAAGKKGGRAIRGYWEEDGLTDKVSAITVDSYNQIWVVENWNYPRRISVWKENDYVKDFIGNPGYMAAGGSLHDTDPQYAYVGPNEMVIDRENNTYEMTRVLWVPDLSKGETFEIGVTNNQLIQHFRSDAGGVEREFIYVSSGRGGANVLYTEMENGVFQPFWATFPLSSLKSPSTNDKYVAHQDTNIYRPNTSLTNEEVFSEFFTHQKDTVFFWNDYDGEGDLDYEECEAWYGYPNSNYNAMEAGWGNRVNNKMQFILVDTIGDNANPGRAYLFTPEYYTEDGIPRYTRNSMDPIDAERPFFQGDNIITDDGKIFSIRTKGGASPNKYFDGVKTVDLESGKDLMWYANYYPGVHGSGGELRSKGLFKGSLKTMGIVEAGDNTQVACVRGYLGQDFLITLDGYYVQTLFRDARIPMLRMPDNEEDAEGLDMSEYSENGEPFSGIFVKQSDGKYRLTTSSQGPTMIICEVKGLETIKYIEPFKIRITEQDLIEAKEFNERPAETLQMGGNTASGSKKIVINKTKRELTIDGNLSDWIGISDVHVDKGGAENADISLAYDDKYLYALYSVTDESPMLNSGTDNGILFKTGDVCDMMFRTSNSTSGNPTEGDVRVVMTEIGGKPIAMLMKQVSGIEKKEYQYASPVMTMVFDYVDVFSEAEVAVVRDTENGVYVLEAKMPLDRLGLTPQAGALISGDVGIVTSDTIGTKNENRIYYHNQDTNLVWDLPSEARLEPSKWGVVEFGE